MAADDASDRAYNPDVAAKILNESRRLSERRGGDKDNKKDDKSRKSNWFRRKEYEQAR